MKKHEITILAFKLAAIFVSINAVATIEAVISNWYMIPPDQIAQALSIQLLPAAIYIMFGVLLWFIADSVANRIFPEVSVASETILPKQDNTSSKFEIWFLVIGLYVVIQSLPNLLNQIATYIFILPDLGSILSRRTNQQMRNIQAQISIFSSCIKLAIGLLLLLKPRQCASIITTLSGLKLRKKFTEVSG
jgi:hypothetical protein